MADRRVHVPGWRAVAAKIEPWGAVRALLLHRAIEAAQCSTGCGRLSGLSEMGEPAEGHDRSAAVPAPIGAVIPHEAEDEIDVMARPAESVMGVTAGRAWLFF